MFAFSYVDGKAQEIGLNFARPQRLTTASKAPNSLTSR